MCVLSHFSRVRRFSTLWTVTYQASLSAGFSDTFTAAGCIPSSRGPSQPRDRTCISYVSSVGRWGLYHQHRLGSPTVAVYQGDPQHCESPACGGVYTGCIYRGFPLYIRGTRNTESPACGGGSLTKLLLTLAMESSPAGSSVHGISQERILEWVVISFFREPSYPGFKPTSPGFADGLFTNEPPGMPSNYIYTTIQIIYF